MRLFFDRRLGYLVTAPGQESPLSGLTAKAGDTTEVQIVFGRSSDPTGAASIIESATWTPENLAGGTVISIGIKEDGDYGDGALLAGTSSFSLDAPSYTYTFTLPLNTTAINTALLRLDANAANDIATLNCQFEVTYQVGGSGGWESSILPVPFLLYNDVIGGDEGTPVNVDSPAEYLLKAAGIEWLPTVTSKIGGTAADLDAVPTVARPLNAIIAFLDSDDASNLVRLYRLESGTDAEASPGIIRPDDYSGSNQRIWRQSYLSGDLLLPDEVSQAEAEAGTNTTVRSWTAERVKQAIKALEDSTVAEPPNGLASSVANEIVLFSGTDGKQLKRATGTGLAKITAGVLSAATPGTDFANAGPITTSGATMATARMLGRTTASTGAPEEITVGGGLTLSAGVLSANFGNGLPNGTVSLTANTNLTAATHNGRFIECAGSMTSVTILRQASSAWESNSHFWIVNRRASGTITVIPDGMVVLNLDGTASADFVLTLGDGPVHIWRDSENFWRVLS